MTESLQAWEKRLHEAAFAEGRHVIHSWKEEYEEGGDCMPQGWYSIGLDENGAWIDFPIRHEYGPFADREEMREFQKEFREKNSFCFPAEAK